MLFVKMLIDVIKDYLWIEVQVFMHQDLKSSLYNGTLYTYSNQILLIETLFSFVIMSFVLGKIFKMIISLHKHR